MLSPNVFHSEGSFHFSNVTEKPRTSEKASFEMNNISKKWSSGIKTFGPMTRAGMNFDRLACWRNDPSASIKRSNETVRIVSSWRHVKYFGKLKWDRVHSMLFHLSGSTAPQEKPYMSPQVSSVKCEVGLWRKFTVWKHLFSSRSMYCVSSLPCAILTVRLSVSAHWYFCVSCYAVHLILQSGQT